jgi:serine protease Do
MNTLINGIGRGLAFAIPSDLLREISEQLMAHGKVHRAWLGIRMMGLPESGRLRERFQGVSKGIVVSTIEANSPAYASDLRPMDLITAIDGKQIAEPRQLQREILRQKVGAVVQLTVWRAGRTLEVPVTMAELPEAVSPTAANSGLPEPRREVLGIVLLDTDAGGPRIVEIAPGSPAARTELAPGDTILAIDGEPLTSAEEAVEALEAAALRNSQKGVLINFERAQKKSWLVIERADR